MRCALTAQYGKVSNADDPVIDDSTNIVNGTKDNDPFLAGLAGSQRINGLGGDDTLVGYAGADILDGGAGVDWAAYPLDSADIEIDLETGTAMGGQAEGDVLIRIENISGGDDILTGSAGNDVFSVAPGHGSDRITDFGTGDDRLQFELGLFANLEAVRTAARNTDDGNLEIALSATETLTLEGVTRDALTAETVTTLDASGNDITTPSADANSASDAPVFELDDLAMDEEALMRLAASEGMTLNPPEPQTAQSASEKLALADPLEPPPALAYLPPYSPDLNPIEQTWAQVKAIRRKKPCTIEALFKEAELNNHC